MSDFAKVQIKLTTAERAVYADRLRAMATVEAQADTSDPAAAVAMIEWMITQFVDNPET